MFTVLYLYLYFIFMLVVDIIIACLIGYALYKGFKEGLVLALISLVSLIVGIFLSLKFSFLFKDWILEKTQWSANVVTICAFVFTFLLVLIAIQLLGKALTKIIKTVALGGLNRLAGAVFLGLKMILIISVVLNLFQKINYNHYIATEETLNKSLFYHPIEDFSKLVYPMMEEWYQMTLEAVDEQVDKLDENLKEV
ncbi:CvpA family protein [Paenimyroides tangerinum]|uniref:CvpA family protein n=1 Tax=Paenimyroides tangerinum TaxID=2488728 RepID=A0A3P3W0N3_9FLAO|nr:CvpA family protein [Paenimyroides tangerinum]RRJ88037.1 CvpA family protein [Paenimyroides tangerinum]